MTTAPAADDENPYGDDLAPWKDALDNIRSPVLATKDFIVYIDADGELDWQTSKTWDDKGALDAKKHNRVLNRVAELETIPCQDLSETNRIHFRRLIGEGLVRSLKHEYALANEALSSAGAYIDQRSSEVARAWYLQASIAAAGPCLMTGLIVWSLRALVTPLIGQFGLWCVLAGCAGAGGALLSVIVRQGKIPVDCVAGKYLHCLEGASRIIAGGLSGFLAVLAVQSGLILATVARGPHPEAVYLVVGFAAGFAERFASSIIAKVDLTHLSATRRKEREHHET